MLFDTGRVSGTMERIFPAATPPVAAGRTNAGRAWVATAPSGVRRARVGARGSVAVVFAMLAMAIGLAASRLLPISRPPTVRAAAVAPRGVTPAPAAPVIKERRSDIRLSVPPSIAGLQERAVAPPRRVAAARAPEAVAAAAIMQTPAAVAVEKPVGARSVRTPHLTGEALVRALAQDVIDTRVLNEAILRDQAARSRRAGEGGN